MLIPKVEQRISQYLNFLEKNAYRKITDLEFEMYEAEKTYRLPPENANWKKIKTPANWGKEWTCFWFRAEYLPPSSDGPIFLSVTPNADSLAFIDGKPAGAFNMCHNKIRIDADGKKHTLHIESYSGHYYGGCGPFEGASIVINIGKVLPSFPNTFEGGCLLERREAVFSLFYDVRALYETAKIADLNSLRKARILKGLSFALNGISFNAEGEELDKQAAAAAKELAPFLALKNSPTTPAVHLIGHAHIDHAWLWHIAETERKAARTFANMLRFIKEYPEFIFIQSQPCQLEIIKNEYPDIFEEVKEAYKKGNWEPNGGMWAEADCNIPSGESLVRQFLVGKKANREMLGFEADTLWLPDVFGYAAALPQIMAGCRIKYFVTSKINWNDTTRFPYETFIWRGIDGTGIKTHFLSTLGPGAGYNGKVVPEELAAVWNSVQHKEVQSACVKSIGEGDGGGGTLRADLEMARRLNDLEGTPRSAWKKVSAALEEIFSDGEFPDWRGELYLELHRGTYTTQARTKRNNRLLEFALRKAELFCSIAALEGKGEYPGETLLDCWKRVLTCQFHDIIPGSSIRRVYAEAEAASAKTLTKLAEITGDATKRLLGLAYNESSKDMNIFAFNDLSWERKTALTLPETTGRIAALQGTDGSVYPVQQYVDYNGKERQICALAIPSLGWTRLTVLYDNNDSQTPFKWHENTLETPFYRITFNAFGRITSLIDRRQDREMVAHRGAFNAFVTAEDVPVFWDAWDIDADWTRHIKQETRLVSTEAAACGPVCFRLRRIYEIGKASRLVQDMVCYAGDPRIDFDAKVTWREKRTLLKAEFDTAINSGQVRCETQYGHIMRNTHHNLMQDRARFEICAHKWISLEEEDSGIALMNDCKYGFDVEGGRMRVSLLRSPAAPDPEADQGEHCFTYSILPFQGSFGTSGVIRSAYELNSPAEAASVPADQIISNAIQGVYSFCTVEGNNVIIESVKAPEDGDRGELILRLYECLGGRAKTALRFNRELKTAAETDMLEENPRPLPITNAHDMDLNLEFRPFEIKTIRVKFAAQPLPIK
ncbi:MAG: glycosyl hydrolase-related protein [Treponema sp.]|jgi:alpha-mannosidase|nr:glycosyl hydrolase-related protein [Treponema sp.]